MGEFKILVDDPSDASRRRSCVSMVCAALPACGAIAIRPVAIGSPVICCNSAVLKFMSGSVVASQRWPAVNGRRQRGLYIIKNIAASERPAQKVP